MPTLDWIGKSAVVNHHRQVPYRDLCCDNELSAGDPDSGNLLVQGDNLLALKALLPSYAGKVKCIYIDPPYNTGSEGWIYNDNVNSPEIREWLGKVVGKEAEDLSRHDKWLCMMYPRLVLLREFLSEDGVIFISIDDNEVHNLRAVMGEIFGDQNFVANVIWQKKYTRANDATYFSDNHDFLVCFARDKKRFRIGRIERTNAQDKAYKNPDNHPLGPWKPTPLHAKSGTDARPYRFRNGVVGNRPRARFGGSLTNHSSAWTRPARSGSEKREMQFLSERHFWVRSTRERFPSQSGLMKSQATITWAATSSRSLFPSTCSTARSRFLFCLWSCNSGPNATRSSWMRLPEAERPAMRSWRRTRSTAADGGSSALKWMRVSAGM